MNFKFYLRSIGKLACVKRYSQAELAKPESVLEHSGEVALVCLGIGMGLRSEGFNIDIGQLMTKAILHDFDEIITGDVARPVKYFSETMRNEFREMEHKNMGLFCDKITKKLSVSMSFMSLWKDAKVGVEGSIVSAADLICVIHKIHDEVCIRNNLTMLDYYDKSYSNSIYQKIIVIEDAIKSSSVFLKDIENQLLDMLNEIEIYHGRHNRAN